uniref:BRWD/PHIP N-terminal domain-containing protein n=1 Tax=Theropithecus gelada TaxID=9565 RepID=A0A8D2G066_THEGE
MCLCNKSIAKNGNGRPQWRLPEERNASPVRPRRGLQASLDHSLPPPARCPAIAEPLSAQRPVPLADSGLCFLIARYLSAGSCRRAAQVLVQELEQCQLLRKRLDWEGNEHNRNHEEFVLSSKHVAPDHLLQICQAKKKKKEIPPRISRVASLFGAGRQPLLLTAKGDLI